VESVSRTSDYGNLTVDEDGILGETGLRMKEGMNLKRHLFDVKRRRITVEEWRQRAWLRQ
jgi:hypothetical protein